MEWIRAEEKWPEKADIYFAYLPNLKPNKGVMILFWNGDAFEIKDYQNEITHWMPLVFPTPPKKD